jgi:predicted DCC family thiol-disulfide oxidoreductase YuxK
MRIPVLLIHKHRKIFFNWTASLHYIGQWMYKEEMDVLYDGSCKLCPRTMAFFKTFDIFGRVEYLDALDQGAIKERGLQWLDPTALLRDMHVVVGKKSWTGFSAYRVLAVRIPILWPILPFLYLWPIPPLARRIYRHVADSRSCSISHASPLKTRGKKH